MNKIIITEQISSTKIHLDYFYGTNILISDTSISFDCNGQAKDVVLVNISRDVFDTMNSSTIGYYEGKMKEKGVDKKTINFVKAMLEYYLSEKNK